MPASPRTESSHPRTSAARLLKKPEIDRQRKAAEAMAGSSVLTLLEKRQWCARLLAERARKAGVDVRLDIFPQMQHVFQMCAGRAPEADVAVGKFAEGIPPKLGLGGASGSMPISKCVLIIGFDPQYLDFSSPDLAPLNLSAEKVMAGFTAETERLRDLGYESDGCLVDLGETAGAAVASQLRAKEYDCVIIGAGIRANPKYFLLFERLLNVVHELAPKARIGFNTKPTDTVDAVQRWL